MYRFLISTIVALAVVHLLLGLPAAQYLTIWIVAFFLLGAGFRWTLTQKLPAGTGRTFLALLLGAPLLVMLLNLANNYLRQAEAQMGPLYILAGVCLAAWLGPKIWRGQKRFKR